MAAAAQSRHSIYCDVLPLVRGKIGNHGGNKPTGRQPKRHTRFVATTRAKPDSVNSIPYSDNRWHASAYGLKGRLDLHAQEVSADHNARRWTCQRPPQSVSAVIEVEMDQSALAEGLRRVSQCPIDKRSVNVENLASV
jgi:hypothetical protein